MTRKAKQTLDRKDTFQKLSKGKLSEIRSLIEESDAVEFTVISGSMRPLIEAGEKIRVRSLKKIDRPLQPFDIVLFVKDQLLFCHYLLRFNSLPGPDGRKFITTRGLASPGEDLPVYEDEVLGLIVSHHLGRWDRLKLFFRLWRGKL